MAATKGMMESSGRVRGKKGIQNLEVSGIAEASVNLRDLKKGDTLFVFTERETYAFEILKPADGSYSAAEALLPAHMWPTVGSGPLSKAYDRRLRVSIVGCVRPSRVTGIIIDIFGRLVTGFHFLVTLKLDKGNEEDHVPYEPIKKILLRRNKEPLSIQN
ncbi:MAG: hypothetical protein PHI53_00995 [Candidatus Pacebacteria bacterium]|nr:hypothetical protein [Candidatus Paceibacterota bacterium]